ncbi:hypothetical protein RJ640_012536 [Escallonia rubra]|uniref:Uncharacterized protein n=1 Tax=Escallonia rubra TaxID=112253 RepID=A0AA88RS47_9ASTE|nr:hypothetical protein RJ640_012536 [Escallonia rubra]
MVITISTSTLNRFPNLSTVGHWNSSIREAVNQGHSYNALLLFRQMKQTGLEPNNLTFPSIAKACGKLLNLIYPQIIHTHVVKSQFQSDKYVQTALVDMYVKCNHLDVAHNLFERMPARDIASWNVMLVGSAQVGFHDRVLNLFNRMRFHGVQPDSVTVLGLTQTAALLKDLKFVNAVHSYGVRIGIDADVSVANTWVSAYAKCGDLSSAEKVFSGIDSNLLSVVSWNSIIAGCAYFERTIKAITFYQRMLNLEIRPDISTILNLLSSFVQPEALCQGKLIHCHGIKVGCHSDISVLNTLISMYSKSGDIHSARHVFDGMMEKSCVSWTAIIGGYAEKGDLDEALALFHSMQAAGEKPDFVTVLYLISGCGQIGALETGRWMDSFVAANGLKGNVMVCNALIDMYVKCGSIRDAQKLFCTMNETTIVSWTTMISGCALNGKFKEALEHFFLMLELGLKPNYVTFLAVLQACNHAGFLEKGRECFALMTKVHRLQPGLDHYSCMADLLGRRGKLNDALELILNMPVEPDARIWGALLGACKIHHNIEIGEYAAHRLFELEPQAAAPYVEMANIYASAGRWDGVAATRASMKFNQVTKFPGQSVVHLNGKSHKFSVEDRCHAEDLLIYEALDGLALQMKEELDLLCVEELFYN